MRWSEETPSLFPSGFCFWCCSCFFALPTKARLLMNRGMKLQRTFHQPSIRSPYRRTMILLFKLPSPRREAERPIKHVEDQQNPTGLPRLLCMRTGLLLLFLELLIVESQFPHPPQTHRQATCDGDRRNGTILLHRQVQVFPLPLRFIAHGHVSGFHQQSPQQTIALLGDV